MRIVIKTLWLLYVPIVQSFKSLKENQLLGFFPYADKKSGYKIVRTTFILIKCVMAVGMPGA